jgi:hypothetical protein
VRDTATFFFAAARKDGSRFWVRKSSTSTHHVTNHTRCGSEPCWTHVCGHGLLNRLPCAVRIECGD